MMPRILACAAVVVALLSSLPGPPQAADPPAREVSVDRVVLTSAGFGIVLRAQEGGDTIEMMVGFLEGQSIDMARRKQKAERPMTHDLFKDVLDRTGWKIERVLVRELVDGVFRANLVLMREGKRETYDARPSDAIALALRGGARVFVAEKVFEQQRKDNEQPARKPPSTRIT